MSDKTSTLECLDSYNMISTQYDANQARGGISNSSRWHLGIIVGDDANINPANGNTSHMSHSLVDSEHPSTSRQNPAGGGGAAAEQGRNSNIRFGAIQCKEQDSHGGCGCCPTSHVAPAISASNITKGCQPTVLI